LLVSGQTNVRYLTGLASSNAAVLVEPDGDATLYTDFRYLERARAASGVEVVETARDLIGSVGALLAGRRLTFEAPHVSYDTYGRLAAAGVELIPVGSHVGSVAAGPVEELRRVKRPEEIDAVRRACALSDALYAELAGERFTGRTDRELAWWIESAFHDAGAAGISFASIVASGENGASPHAVPGDRVIATGTLVTVDAGCIVDGYCSDCTRTVVVGEIDAQAREVYELVRSAQAMALEAIRAGVDARDADSAARDPIARAGHGEHFGHGLGHGVGLEVHEAPRLSQRSDQTLEVGDVVTVEPGIYLPGRFGVRIEDLVTVTEDGCRNLSDFPKDLRVVA